MTNPVGSLVNASTANLSPGIVRSYDTMGRITAEWQTTPGSTTPLALSYQYDLLGEITSATNGQGTTFTYAYNGGHLRQLTSSLADAQHPGTLFSGAINRVPCDLVLIATPIDVARVLKLETPSLRVTYEVQELTPPTLRDLLAEFTAAHKPITALAGN